MSFGYVLLCFSNTVRNYCWKISFVLLTTDLGEFHSNPTLELGLLLLKTLDLQNNSSNFLLHGFCLTQLCVLVVFDLFKEQ